VTECIICRQEIAAGQVSREHIFPEALGGRLVTTRVCVACNSRLGQIADAPLVNNPLLQFARYAYGIAGRSGVPNPFAGPAHLAGDPKRKVRIHTDSRGVASVHHVTRKERTIDEDGVVRIRLDVDARERPRLPSIVNTVLEREGAPSVSMEEVLRKARTVEHAPTVEQTLSLDLRSPMLGMLKITYELAHHWLGDRYLADPTSQVIAGALLSGIENWTEEFRIRGQIGMSQERHLLRLWSDERMSHIAVLARSGGTLMVMATVYHVFDGSVVISDRAHLYEPVEQSFLAVDAVTGNTREGSLEDELARKLGDERGGQGLGSASGP
jgi:hypothetical protein